MRVTWFEPGTLEAPAAVRSDTLSARERQRTPRGDAQDAQARGADAPSARAREVVEEAGERRAASRLSCLSKDVRIFSFWSVWSGRHDPIWQVPT